MSTVLEPVSAESKSKTQGSEFPPTPAPGSVQVWAWAVGIDGNGHRTTFLPAVVAIDEEGTVIAYCPCLRGCAVQRESEAEALAALQRAAEDVQETYRLEGKCLPLVMREREDTEELRGFIALGA